MSSSSNSPIARRRFLAALALLPLAGLADRAAASAPLAGLRRWGSGEFRRFGFHVYDATLWAGDDPARPPLALRLTYRRNIAGRDIAEASVDEMRKLGAGVTSLRRWGPLMAGIFPDVRPGDSITGLHLADEARFYANDAEIGRVAEPEFARSFFAIWLDPRTSAPRLREALLAPAVPAS